MVDSDASCAPDQDGDGICDTVDLCPTVFDPAQVDLDGDNLGWVCDPYESTEVPITGIVIESTGDLAGNTFAALVRSCSNTSCMNTVVGVSAAGSTIVPGGSTIPQHAWLTSAKYVGPFVTRDERILISPQFDGGIGRLDPASDTFTVLAPRPAYARSDRRLPLELLALRGTTQQGLDYELVRPVGDDLVTVAANAGVFADAKPDVVLRSTPAPTVIAVPHTLAPSPYTYALSTFDTTTKMLQPVSGASGLDELEPFRPLDRPNGLFGEVSYCARKGTQVMYFGVRSNGVTTGALPFASCSFIGADVSPTPLSGFFVSGRDAAQNRALAHVHAGTVTPVFTSEPEPIVVQQYGRFLRVVTTTIANTTLSKAWVITPEGDVHELPLSMRDIAVSVHGDTAHIVGIEDSGNNNSGPLALFRYRPTTGLQYVTLPTTAALGSHPQVVTSAGGGALVSDRSRTWAVPRTSLMPVQLNLKYADGATRGATTVLISPQDSSHPTSQPAIYAYDEIGGTPRLTQLTAEANGRAIKLLDPNDTSDWFATTPDYGLSCSLARIVYVNNLPMLQTTSCGHYGSVQRAGLRANGDVIAWDETAIYVLSPTTATRVASHVTSSSRTLLYDHSTVPERIVGWTGVDPLGGYACLASHPDRCWSLPADATVSQLTADATGDGAFSVMTLRASGTNATTIGVLRSLGTGNRKPPL